ncbi:hypothetical protein [Burkholderia ubonensis]|uniref:Preprotein translocase subunit SecD n=1 Tax=Burkholderia ubonensis TaxID=101571 RepID=A0AAW3N8B9_9BURK|nr:hypothetical protein [Burkholderia ubonensis]KVT53423.1 preprotein translocase subunit SecD [Burkholderia ubonensis]
MRADEMLPDHLNQLDLNGTTIRKGSVGAFLANARVLTDPHAEEAERSRAATDAADVLPALRALGLFDVFEIRDAALRAWVDAR